MASTIDIVVDEKFTQLVAEVVRKHFPDIRQYVPKIQGLVRTKTNADGDIIKGMSSPIHLKKTPPIYTACGVPHYLIVIDGCYQNEAADHEIRGMIGNALLSIDVNVTSDDEGRDVVKFRSRKPDLTIFTEAVRMFGAFTPAILTIHDVARGVAMAGLSFVKPEPDAEDEPEQDAREEPEHHEEREPEHSEEHREEREPEHREEPKPKHREEQKPEQDVSAGTNARVEPVKTPPALPARRPRGRPRRTPAPAPKADDQDWEDRPRVHSAAELVDKEALMAGT